MKFNATDLKPTAVSVYSKLSGIWKTSPDINLCEIDTGNELWKQMSPRRQDGG